MQPSPTRQSRAAGLNRPMATNGVRLEWHLLKANCRIFVIPAQAGIHEYRHH
jgi:hypothetical protein